MMLRAGFFPDQHGTVETVGDGQHSAVMGPKGVVEV
jgi:hypothetical protein